MDKASIYIYTGSQPQACSWAQGRSERGQPAPGLHSDNPARQTSTAGTGSWCSVDSRRILTMRFGWRVWPIFPPRQNLSIWAENQPCNAMI